MNPNVDFYIVKLDKCKEEVKILREILLSFDLKEEFKWGVPCYTYKKENIALIHVFKDYYAILFFKGANLSDPFQVLVQHTENVQTSRQLRFKNIKEIINAKEIIKSYIQEAIEIEKQV